MNQTPKVVKPDKGKLPSPPDALKSGYTKLPGSGASDVGRSVGGGSPPPGSTMKLSNKHDAESIAFDRKHIADHERDIAYHQGKLKAKRG